MKKMSRLGKKLRTSIADLDQACDLSADQLAQVAGGMLSGGGLFGGGGGVTVAEHKCWQPSASITNPGEPDTAQDYVID